MHTSWKGQTFNQIISQRRRNEFTRTGRTIFSSSPLKIYRKELIKQPSPCTNNSVSLEDFFAPGRNIINADTAQVFVKESRQDKSCTVCVNDARKRVRSSGNLIKKEGILNTDIPYCTTKAQYLDKSNKAYIQKNLSHFIVGDPTFLDGPLSTRPNLYQPGGLCKGGKVHISGYETTPLFQYIWINGQTYDVCAPDGDYYLEDINTLLHNVMNINRHYVFDALQSRTNIYFIKFVYDIETDRIQIQNKGLDTALYPANGYTTWYSYLYYSEDLDIINSYWVVPEYTIVPILKLLPNDFLQMVGFADAGNYPYESINGYLGTQPDTLVDPELNVYSIKKKYYIMGTLTPKIKSKNLPFSYKTSNMRFATNGAVSASSIVSMRKYETVTEARTVFTSGLVGRIGHALAYNVPVPGANTKYIYGYNNNCRENINI